MSHQDIPPPSSACISTCIFVWCRRSTNVTTTMWRWTLVAGRVWTKLATFVMALCTPLPSALQPISRQSFCFCVRCTLPYTLWQGDSGQEQTTNRQKWLAGWTPQSRRPGSTIIYSLHNENTWEITCISCCKILKLSSRRSDNYYKQLAFRLLTRTSLSS